MTFALVTGASRGIGQAISERLIKQGFYVIGTATSEGGAQTISDRLGSNGEGRVLNVTDATMSMSSLNRWQMTRRVHWYWSTTQGLLRIR